MVDPLFAALAQYVAAAASSATVGLLYWVVRLLKNISETTDANETRSIRNAKALEQAGYERPPARSDIPGDYRRDERTANGADTRQTAED